MAAVLLTGSLTACSMGNRCKDGEVRTLEKGVLKVGMHLSDTPVAHLNQETGRPAGFAPALAADVAESLGLSLVIVDTTEKNLLNSLDAKLYDCVIDTVGISQWNQKAYEVTAPYADISYILEQTDGHEEYPEIGIFGRKHNCLISVIEEDVLQPMIQDGSLSQLSEEYLGKDVIIK